ncbi:hypothetical protein AOQ88_01755 [Candidatus Riesia sp. GBBU]|nr:hypothetical protein AOQ88_01755 [Candidatus Riesia sp. GBBU]
MLIERKNGKPIYLLIGRKEFWSSNFIISNETFIPRSDTERLVEISLNLLKDSFINKVLDLGTGTGAIAISIAKERKNSKVLGIDRKNSIIKIAKLNARRLKIKNVRFMKSNWFKSINKYRFHLIVSNPPYICKNYPNIKEYSKFEPKHSLVSSSSGLNDIRIIIKKSCKQLFNNGWLVLEHGYNQGKSVRKLFCDFNYKNVESFLDYGEKERVTIGRKP